jgi:glyoxylase-like metal-dependent hydrolase (beta-lactamase superfamily II)
MSALEFPHAAPPVGGWVALVPGVRWLRLPVPGGLRHINVWLLEDGEGWTLVDTGMDVPAARAAWDGPVGAALAGRPVTRIVCTHHHPDHAGLAAWLAERHRAPVYMSAAEALLLRDLRATELDPALAAARLAGFRAAGLAITPELESVLSLRNYRRIVSGVPADLRILDDGEVLATGPRRWQVRLVAGHTDGQALLYSADSALLIAGDQVLPRISSNVGLYPERRDPDPVGSFLASFVGLAALDPEPLVLPSHGDVFRGLRMRLGQLAAHHAGTLAEVERLAQAPLTAAALAERLFRPDLDALNRMLAVGEAHAHLHHLALHGRLRVLEAPGEPRRYAAA